MKYVKVNAGNRVKLRKVSQGYYETSIMGNEFTILGPDPKYKSEPGYEWSVTSPDLEIEENFRTLKEVREYLNSLRDRLYKEK